MKKVEIHQINRQFEYLRLKDPGKEDRLLGEILEKGLSEPLACLLKRGEWILLDGFKRLRCCEKLKIHKVAVMSLGGDEAGAMLEILKRSTVDPVHIIEQAGMVEYLHSQVGMGISEMARYLNRSPAWVSVRVGLISRMSKTVRDAVFGGKLPIRSVMYSLKGFTRVKSKAKEVDRFVECVAGKGLSVRQIDTLAGAYFQGSPSMKEQIEHGQLNWTLNQIKENSEEPETLTEPVEIKQLEWLLGSMRRIMYQFKPETIRGKESWLKVTGMIKAILALMPACQKRLEQMND